MNIQKAAQADPRSRVSQYATAIVLISLIVLISGQHLVSQPATGVSTPKRPSTYDYWGVRMVDNYRWLEDWTDKEVRDWTTAQDIAARRYLDGLADRKSIRTEVNRLYTGGSSSYYSLASAGGRLFGLKDDPSKNQPMLIMLGSPDDSTSVKTVFDPNTYDPSGLTAIDFFVPSGDGKLVAISLSKGGSEDGTLYIFDVTTGNRLRDVISNVNYATAGGSVAWNADNGGLFYTRYPNAGEKPAADIHFYQQVYFHKLGSDPSADQYAIGKDFPRIAEIELKRSPDGGHILACVANGDGGEYSFYLFAPDGKWSEIAAFADKAIHANFGFNHDLFLLSRDNAPHGKILRLPLASPNIHTGSVVVKPGPDVIDGFAISKSKLWVVDIQGGPSRLRSIDLKDGTEITIQTIPVSTVGEIVCADGEEVLFTQESYTEPHAWYRIDSASGVASRTAFAKSSVADFSNIEVVREFAVSKDGTRIPMNIIRSKGLKLDGSNPVILYGYGGFRISMSPQFSSGKSLWLNQGGIYVIANLRGGGEYGEEWHEAGRLLHKQNVFDDLVACAEYLIKTGYTSPQRLAIQGGSNGGLLMGAALTQRPDLFRAVVSGAGIYDMLRVELSPNGSFNVTEFGSTKDSVQFAALYAYSPYHHVVNGTAYPGVLFTVGENDGRVDPMQSRKMTARLQDASVSGRPILLRVSSTSGHGIGSSLADVIEEDADIYAFLFDQLGVAYRARQ